MVETVVFGGALVAILAAIALIDWRHQIIPDALNLSLAASGMGYQLFVSPQHLWLQLGTGVAVVAAFGALRRLHSWRTGRVGLGFGDVKMAGASAIWLSPLTLPYFVFAASFAALVFIAGRQLIARDVLVDTRQPFGPFLAASLLATWLAEQHLPSLSGPLG